MRNFYLNGEQGKYTLNGFSIAIHGWSDVSRSIQCHVLKLTIFPDYGAAVRIQLTKHSLRVYSCDSIFNSESDAKAACVQRALDEGILDYIKFGNGQKEPARPSLEDEEPELFDQQRRPPKRKTRPISLQSYYESLPRPFPEPFGNKGAVEINAPSYINTLLQSARGGRLKSAFYWIMDKTTGRKFLVRSF